MEKVQSGPLHIVHKIHVTELKEMRASTQVEWKKRPH